MSQVNLLLIKLLLLVKRVIKLFLQVQLLLLIENVWIVTLLLMQRHSVNTRLLTRNLN